MMSDTHAHTVEYLAPCPWRARAGRYGLHGEVVTEHGDLLVADAEDLHQRYRLTPSPSSVNIAATAPGSLLIAPA